MPAPATFDEFNDFDDWTLSAEDGLALFEGVDKSITLSMVMANLGDGAN